MRAIVRDPGGAVLAEVPEPAPAPDEVVIDVAFAGVCRTDLAAADGAIAVAPGRVLGHELAGRVRATGAAVDGLAVGDPVTVIPFAACRACAGCAASAACAANAASAACAANATSGRCAAPRWLGVDVDGAFADRVRAPASTVMRLPPGLPLHRGAYVEPVAAALGVLPFVERGARVLVWDRGRIAELTARVLAAHGAAVARSAGEAELDVVIDHGGDPAELLALLRPGGTLILKSRARRPPPRRATPRRGSATRSTTPSACGCAPTRACASSSLAASTRPRSRRSPRARAASAARSPWRGPAAARTIHIMKAGSRRPRHASWAFRTPSSSSTASASCEIPGGATSTSGAPAPRGARRRSPRSGHSAPTRKADD
jgi:D-arabinose 1-dehydrogenase-like Zn-dependent alcohol dehydrogenase